MDGNNDMEEQFSDSEVVLEDDLWEVVEGEEEERPAEDSKL